MLDPASPGLINRSVLVSCDRTLVLSEKVPLGKFQSSVPKPDGLHILIPFYIKKRRISSKIHTLKIKAQQN